MIRQPRDLLMNKSTRQMHALPPKCEDGNTTYLCHKRDKFVCSEHPVPKYEGIGLKKTLSEDIVCVVVT